MKPAEVSAASGKTDPPLLEIRNLLKTFGKLTAVRGISFEVRRGVCFGLLGPNGAGKTTTIEIIEDIIPPTSGEILYQGRPRSSVFRETVGIQFQHTELLAFLKVRETLKTFQSFYRRPADMEEITEICQLGDLLDRYTQKISGGQKQRVLLAMALINDPELVFLDEPSTGLDPQARRNLWEIIRKIRAKGKTVILTTHYMEEAQQLCDEIAIIDHGRIIAQGSPDSLIRAHCRGTTVSLPAGNVTFNPQETGLPCLETEERIEFYADDIRDALTRLMAQGADMKEMAVHSPNLEDVFLKLTGRTLRE